MAFKSILDQNFKYRNAASTDLSKTFERLRREQRVVTSDSRTTDSPSAKVVATIGGPRRHLQSNA
jgi:hypothetical protein